MVAIVVSTALCAPVLAQVGTRSSDIADAGGEQSSTIEEAVVTARRRQEALTDVRVAITVLDAAAIRGRGITELNQVEKFAPNVVQTRFGQGNTGHAVVFMRGIGLQDHMITTDPAVGIYLDGVYLGRNMGANMDLVTVDRVEVVRGPQGSLHGRNALGGAINVVTRQPVGANDGRVDIRVGSLGRRNAHFFADVGLHGTLAVAVSGGVKSRGGVGKALLIANPEAEIGEILQGAGRAAVRWEPAPGWRLLATADVARSDQGVTPHAVVVFNPANAFGLRQEDQPRNPDDTHSRNNELMSTQDETRGYSVTLRRDFAGGLRARAIVSRRSMWFEGGLDNEKAPATLIEFPERGEAEQTTVEVQLSGDARWGDWVAGVYAFDEEGFNRTPFVFRANGLADGRPAVIPALDFDGLRHIRQTARSRALFAHLNVTLAPRWTLGVGARQTRDKKIGTGFLHYLPAPVRRSDAWRALTGDVALTYRLNRNVNAFVSYARGYQAGGYPPRPHGGPETFRAFGHTVADSFEVGVKGAFGAAWRLNAALFHVRYDDLPAPVNERIGEGLLTLTRNAAGSRANGLEVEGVWRAAEGLDVYFALGYLDIEISAVDEGVRGISVGDSPAFTPKHTISVSPRKRWRLDSGGTITARLHHYRRGRMFGQPVNTPLIRMSALALTSASVAYASADRSWEVALYGDNLTDQIYPLAKWNLGPAVLTINSNDRREYGLRFGRAFGP